MVYLRGDLGTGKTTLAQGFLRACGVTTAVRSPTYTLTHFYSVGAQTVMHVDLYRLRALGELEHLGLSEWAVPGYVWLIEWPERGAAGLPPADLLIELSVAEHGHEAQLSAGTPAGSAWLARLAAGANGNGS